VGDAPRSVEAGLRRDGRARATEIGLWVIIAIIAVFALYRARRFHEDDAYITLRYAQRWIGGKGLTWTDGERVEGYSNPLWLLQIALLGRLHVALPTAARLLGIAYFAGLLALFQRAGASPFSALVLATIPGLSLWAMSGLETASFAFWLVLGARMTARIARDGERAPSSNVLAGAALAAAALTRPEGLGVGVVALAWMAFSRRWGSLRVVASALAGPVIAWEIFRLAYYGDLLANSSRAKVGDYPLLRSLAEGVEYLAASSSSWAYGVLASLAVLALTRRTEALGMLAMAVPILVALLLGGGDHMLGARLFVPAAALVVFVAGVHGPSRQSPKRRWAAVAVLTFAAALHAPRALARDREPDRAAVIGAMVGSLLERTLPPGALVAISVAGSTAYVAPSLRFIDTLGLNDRSIARRAAPIDVTLWQAMAAHRRGDGAYVLSREPDVVILGGAAGYLGFEERQWFLTDYELLHLGGFRAGYAPFQFPLPEAAANGLPGLTLKAYVRLGSVAGQTFARTGRRLSAPWEIPADRWTIAATATGVQFEEE
jgi:hypothetical protein